MNWSHVKHRLRHLPSFLVGSARQTAAGLSPASGPLLGEPGVQAVLLVPGAFCPASVMNRLGRELHARGFTVLFTPDFGQRLGPLCNVCRLEEAATLLLHDAMHQVQSHRLEKLWVAAHSNGGLITMLALDLAASVGHAAFPALVSGVVTMATPFSGTRLALPLTSMLPMAQDIIPHSTTLQRTHRWRTHIKLALRANADFLLPPDQPMPDDVPVQLLDGFQHMDFLVGADHQVARTAALIQGAIQRQAG